MTGARTAVPAELSNGPVVVKAWAPWCSSCRALGPHVEHAEAASGVPVFDLRVNADPDELVALFGVRATPTLIGLRDGTEVGRLIGFQAPEAIDALFATTRTGTGRVATRAATSLVAMRGAAGAGLAAAGLVLGSLVLVVVGAAVLAWMLAGLVGRR